MPSGEAGNYAEAPNELFLPAFPRLEALITERIPSTLKTYAFRVLVASGFLDNLYDEDVEVREAWRIFRKAGAYAGNARTFETMLLCMLIELKQELRILERRFRNCSGTEM